MVLSFSKDPLDGVSTSSNAPSEQETDTQSVGDDYSIDGNWETNDASVNPSDEESIEVIPRDPNFFDTQGAGTAPSPPSNPNSGRAAWLPHLSRPSPAGVPLCPSH
ncbi:hypothetical protein ACA910_021404 [Epithemia clementina (nom. ined.)]